MADLVRLKALTAFTQFVPSIGQVHGDPDNKDAQFVEVPEGVADFLVEYGKAEHVAATPAKAGKTGRNDGYAMKYVPIGKYLVSGPGISDPVEIKGKAEAEAYIDGIKEGLAHDATSQSSDEAPVS